MLDQEIVHTLVHGALNGSYSRNKTTNPGGILCAFMKNQCLFTFFSTYRAIINNLEQFEAFTRDPGVEITQELNILHEDGKLAFAMIESYKTRLFTFKEDTNFLDITSTYWPKTGGSDFRGGPELVIIDRVNKRYIDEAVHRTWTACREPRFTNIAKSCIHETFRVMAAAVCRSVPIEPLPKRPAVMTPEEEEARKKAEAEHSRSMKQLITLSRLINAGLRDYGVPLTETGMRRYRCLEHLKFLDNIVSQLCHPTHRKRVQMLDYLVHYWPDHIENVIDYWRYTTVSDISLNGVDKELKKEIEDFIKQCATHYFDKPRNYNSYVHNKEVLAFIRRVFLPDAARIERMWNMGIWKGLFDQLSIPVPVKSNDGSVQIKVPHSEPCLVPDEYKTTSLEETSLHGLSDADKLVARSSSTPNELKSNTLTPVIKELSPPLEPIEGCTMAYLLEIS